MKKLQCLAIALFIKGYIIAQTVQKTMFLLPDTGQTTSYTATLGEDNDYNINLQSFTNNNNGTVSDNVTGLIWQQGDSGELTIEDAITYCDNLVLGGFSDWRLPTKEESMSILNFDRNNPALNTTYYSNTNAEYWWTSTVQFNNTNTIWITNAGGGTGPKNKTETISAGGTKRYHARAVRSGTLSTNVLNFTENNDGTITDNVTGLMWQKSPLATTYTWEQSLLYAENLTASSYTDWRLPTIKELVSINSELTNAPSANTTFFPTIISSRYWSSTSQFAPGSTAAWFNDFQNYGITSYELKTSSYPIICVRGTPTLSTANFDKSKDQVQVVSPFTNQIEIISLVDSQDTNVTLFDTNGNQIQQWNLRTNTENQKSILNIKQNLVAGIYIIKIQSNTLNFSTKIVHIN